LVHPLLAIERPNNASLIVTNDPRHEAKHVAFFRRWGFENFLVDARYVLDPAQENSSVITGFPAVILKRPESDDQGVVPGRHERSLVDWSRQLAPASKQFVDCGAHTGSWALIMAAHFREVHAFEPQRLIFQQLCGNVVLNRLENVFAYNIGLDSSAGRLPLHCYGPDHVRSTARRDVAEAFQVAGDSARTETVDVSTLDSFADVLTDVGLMRIAVEGLELRVLKGAVDVIERNKLPKLMIECWSDPWYRADKQELLDFLDDLGYEVISIRGYPDILLAEP